MILKNLIKYGNVTDTALFEEFKLELEKINNSTDSLKVNYTLDRLKLEEHLSFDLLYDEEQNKIITWGGLFNRQGWPKGVCRISNRVYVNPEYRKPFYQFLNTTKILPKQFEEHKSELKFVFISRERIKGKYYLRRANRLDYFQDWIVSDKMYQLVPDVEKRSVYHYILYNNVGNIDIPFKYLDKEEQWYNLQK